ncbi:MAG: galactose-1-phosphate uridylyltransferase [Deltaproteobacteria bacterium]|nr:galactose-1-phosphate uridylyltransferase [Deltaproteobacteria bacterium]
MPELRHDPIQKRWVIVATERARRPSDFKIERDNKGNGNCPFCFGHEGTTPPEIRAFRDPSTEPNTEGWKVRVVPNKFPALRIEGDAERAARGQYDRMNGIGAHEVIIETPHHDKDLADLPVEDVALVLQMYRERLLDLQNDPRFRYILVFRNRGSSAGASLSHPHSQLIATPITPRTVAIELESARDHFSLKERCIFCDIIAQELEQHSRVVAADEDFVSWCPYASRFPFEVTLAPRVHSHDFGTMDNEMTMKMARHLREVLRRIKHSLDDPPYNYMLHTAPAYHLKPRRPGYWATIEVDWHWHLEILPRLTKTAGFEWGTGFYINPTPPEDAARFLREVQI